MISRCIFKDASNIPLVGYKLLPGLISIVQLLKDTFTVTDVQKDSEGNETRTQKNLLDHLQAYTNEGIDFAQEKVFETPHPIPNNDYQ